MGQLAHSETYKRLVLLEKPEIDVLHRGVGHAEGAHSERRLLRLERLEERRELGAGGPRQGEDGVLTREGVKSRLGDVAVKINLMSFFDTLE